MRNPESGSDFVGDWRRNAEHLAASGLYDPADEHDACGVGLVSAIDGKPRREVVELGDRGAQVGVASRRGRRRRQDRRRRRHPRRRSRRTSSDAYRRAATSRSPAGWRSAGVPAAHRPGRAGALPGASSRPRSCEGRLRNLRLASGAGERRRHRREGQRDPARDRADHDRQPPGRGRHLFERTSIVIRRRIEKRVLAERSRTSTSARCRAARSSTRACSSPSSSRVLPRPARRALRLATSRSTISAIRPTPSPPGGWRSPSASSPITARSTPSGQRQLDEGPRAAHGARKLRRVDRGPEAGDPAGQLGFGAAGQRLRADDPQRPRRCRWSSR